MKFQVDFQENSEQQRDSVSLPSKHKLEKVIPQVKLIFSTDLSRTKGGVFNILSSQKNLDFIRANLKPNLDFTLG